MDATRLSFAIDTATRAAAFALEKFRDLDNLEIESKGHQDLVSDADRATEQLVRTAIAEAFPDDGIVGEEYDRVTGTTGYDWVIDPIDGTANYVRGLPHWCVVIACTHGGLPVVGVIVDPSTGETFHAAKGEGAFVNGRALRVSRSTSLGDGTVAVGASGRSERERTAAFVSEILMAGGLFFRSASGALALAYVSAGRLIGYVEDHMNSWDCFAGMLMIEEAGGTIFPIDPATALDNGTRVVAAAPGVYADLQDLVVRAYD